MSEIANKVKAIICDVDGTLLTSGYVCSPATAAAIVEVRERGYLFGLCTGRDAIGTQGQLADWGLEGLVDVIVGSGGGEVLDVKSGAYELSHPLPGDAIKEVMAHYADMDVSFVIPYRGVLYTPVDHPRMELISKADGLPYEVVDFEEFLAEPKPKVMIFCMPEYMEQVSNGRRRSRASVTAPLRLSPPLACTNIWIRVSRSPLALSARPSCTGSRSTRSSRSATPTMTLPWCRLLAWVLLWETAANGLVLRRITSPMTTTTMGSRHFFASI